MKFAKFTTALLLAAALTQPLAVRAKPSKINWQPSLSEAKAEAKRSGKPIFVMFHAPWCGACKMLEKTALRDAKVIEELKRWVPVAIDTDQDEATANAYRIESLPTLLFIKPSGSGGFRFEGAPETAELLEILKDVHAKTTKK